MAFVPGADFDVFISYSWADNQSGWVDRFEKALTERVHVLLGQKPDFFRDLRELSGEQDFTREIQDKLEKSASLVAVLSPGYFKSDYCRMERNHYVAHVDGGLQIGTRVKLIKAVKLPHPQGLHRSFVRRPEPDYPNYSVVGQFQNDPLPVGYAESRPFTAKPPFAPEARQ